MGACLGDLPRFGALDDQTLHPSPSDFSLQPDKNYLMTRSQKNTFLNDRLSSQHGHKLALFCVCLCYEQIICPEKK